MLHIATVHWQEERWIAPQLRHLRRNLGEHRIWASLNGIDPEPWRDEFAYIGDLQGDHHDKLNQLVERIETEAAPDDLLLFLDSDAFPIAPMDGSLLGGFPLVAVRRDENAGEPMPHPCFCLTTVGFWQDIGGDWGEGRFHWTAPNGDRLTDGGANLLGILLERGIEWRPLLRSNRFELDPLWFGIYGDVVYHHGAGSRPAISYRQETQRRDVVRRARDAAIIPAGVPVLGRLERSVRYRRALERVTREQADDLAAAKVLSESVIADILRDEDFHLRFTQDPAPTTA